MHWETRFPAAPHFPRFFTSHNGPPKGNDCDRLRVPGASASASPSAPLSPWRSSSGSADIVLGSGGYHWPGFSPSGSREQPGPRGCISCVSVMPGNHLRRAVVRGCSGIPWLRRARPEAHSASPPGSALCSVLCCEPSRSQLACKFNSAPAAHSEESCGCTCGPHHLSFYTSQATALSPVLHSPETLAFVR